MRDENFLTLALTQELRIKAGQDLTAGRVPDLAPYPDEYLKSLIAEAQKLISERELAGSDQRPHSRACGFRRHDHGPDCSTNCPTCHGGNPAARIPGRPDPLPYVNIYDGSRWKDHGDAPDMLKLAPRDQYSQDTADYPLPLHPMPFVWPSGKRSMFSHGDGIELVWSPPEGYEQDRSKYNLKTVT